MKRTMRLSMAQMRLGADRQANEEKTLDFARRAAGSDLLFFPEIQNAPFFPQYPQRDVERYVTHMDDAIVRELQRLAREQQMAVSPNFYIEAENGRRFDRSLWIDAEGSLVGHASMVHVFQAPQFYEGDYYTPSEDGFKVFDTPLGRVGIVICFDRHLPESIRTCALLGAALVIVPTANCKAEPMELFEWEIRVQAMQNSVFVAMCNRVGLEGEMDFAGESLVADSYGDLIYKADDQERLVTVDLDLSEAARKQEKIPWLKLRRPEWYGAKA